MWKRMIYSVGSAALGLAVLAGCESRVSYDDVEDAKEEVIDERQELEETKQEATSNVAEEESEALAARQKAMKPVIDQEAVEAANEEEREAKDAQQDAQQQLNEEEKEVKDAEATVAETEAKLQAQQARDGFVTSIKAKLDEADQKLKTLKDQIATAEGTAKDDLQKRIDEIQTKRDKVQDRLNEVESNDVLKWEDYRDDTQNAVDELSAELAKA